MGLHKSTGNCRSALNRSFPLALVVGMTGTSILSGCLRDPQKGKLAFLESGKRYEQQNKYPEAAIQFRNAIKLDSRYVDAYYELGKADLAMQQWRDAFSALSQAAQLDPNRVDIQLALAEMYLAAPDAKKAEEVASLILQKDS